MNSEPGTASRLGAALLRTVRQRLELAALDVEEELLRATLLLAAAMVGAMLLGLCLVSLAALVVVVFWESARVASLAGITVLFAAGAAGVAWHVARAIARKPPFLAATLAEFAKDRALLAGPVK